MVSDIPCNSSKQKRTIGALLISEKKNRFLNKKIGEIGTLDI